MVPVVIKIPAAEVAFLITLRITVAASITSQVAGSK